MGLKLQLPVIQNWGCHNCGGCCREHLIEITEDEKRRIDKQRWSSKDGLSTKRPLVEPLGKGTYRIAHQDDGACVFLDEHGLCRIHAKFGEAAKPLACRVYPYAFHPAGGDKLAVSLRFSCPSVVQNLGPSISEQQTDLQKMGGEIVAGKQRDHSAPVIHQHPGHGIQQTTWPDVHRFLMTLDSAISDTSVDFVVRLMRILSWLEVVEQSQFQTIRREKLDDYLSLITDASVRAQPDNDLPVHRPGLLGRILFRQLTAQYARHDTEAQVRRGIRYRVTLLTAALKYAGGRGRIPTLQGSASVDKAFGTTDNADAAVTFQELENPFCGRQPEIDELLTRYFRVKIQGIHFCGPAHYDTTLVDGFRSLALMYPVVMWLARLRAATRQASRLQLPDVQAALAIADHNFGYSSALGMASSRRREVILAKMQQITRLVSWYSQ